MVLKRIFLLISGLALATFSMFLFAGIKGYNRSRLLDYYAIDLFLVFFYNNIIKLLIIYR